MPQIVKIGDLTSTASPKSPNFKEIVSSLFLITCEIRFTLYSSEYGKQVYVHTKTWLALAHISSHYQSIYMYMSIQEYGMHI